MTKTFRFSRSFDTRVEPTAHVKACAAMFGIGVDEAIQVTLYEDLAIKLGPGKIIYITGDSGAGKTCLLNDVMTQVREDPDFALVEAEDFSGLPDRPLVDQFGDWGLKAIGELLSYVGIAEAFVYLRKPIELSDGQRYRFMLAKMIYVAKAVEVQVPVICVDEFLALMDRETARNIAYQVRRVANAHRVCFVVATTHEDIRRDLQPNTSLVMRLNLPPEIQHTALAGI